MKKLLATVCILIALSTSVYAGDIPGTGKQDPPPCTENCGATASTDGKEESTDYSVELIEIVLMFLTFRP